MFGTPALLLILLFSLDTDAKTSPKSPPGTVVGVPGASTPWSEKSRSFTTTPDLVELSELIARAEERAAKGLGPRPKAKREKGRIPGILPAEVLELRKRAGRRRPVPESAHAGQPVGTRRPASP